MILRELSMRGPHETPHGKVEPRGAELPFIVAIGRKLEDAMVLTRDSKDIRRCTVNRGISETRALIGHVPWIPGTGQNEPMLDPVHSMLISTQPGDGSDEPRCEQYAV